MTRLRLPLVLAALLPAAAPAAEKTGVLEGVVRTKAKDVEQPHHLVVEVRKGAQMVEQALCDGQLGGLYRIEKLSPGTYEVRVYRADSGIHRLYSGFSTHGFRPQRIVGVVVKADAVNRLDITLTRGSDLEEIGKPEVAAVQAAVLADEVARLRREVEALRRELDPLKKK